jgi:hypothetical protein
MLKMLTQDLGRINLNDLVNGNRANLRETGLKGVDWTHLAMDRDKWWAPVNTVMSLRVPKNAGNSLTS